MNGISTSVWGLRRNVCLHRLRCLFVGERPGVGNNRRSGYVGVRCPLTFPYSGKNAYFPYTPYWQGTAQLNKACELILEEGLGKVIARHQKVAGYCRGADR